MTFVMGYLEAAASHSQKKRWPLSQPVIWTAVAVNTHFSARKLSNILKFNLIVL